MLGFIILLFIFTSIWLGMMTLVDVQEVKKNWPQYRCKPNIMPFASMYGYDTAENFNFCLMNMFGSEMGAALGPIFSILASIVTTLVTLIQVANSIRVQFATMMGGVNTLFQNFADRFKQLLAAIQMSAYRMKLIMGRLYGAFFAMIYMSIAGMASVQNFTDSVLFDFLDTFCFDPDTSVLIEGKGSIKVKDVQMGDRFEQTGSVVTATFQFESDGQPMVELPGGIVVSTNHYVYSLGTWIQAVHHPLASAKGPWQGGKERPLICFNTSDHRIPIGHFMFLDYDETDEGDMETMAWIDAKLNGKREPTPTRRSFDYTSCIEGTTQIRMKDGSLKSIQTIQLGEEISTGRVIGVIQKEATEVCELPTKEHVTPGLSYWQTNTNQWVRAGDTLPIQTCVQSQIFYTLVVLNSASMETESGTYLRDYVEVHSPDAEQFYSAKVEHLGERSIEMLPAH
jgi:hypothetical protein